MSAPRGGREESSPGVFCDFRFRVRASSASFLRRHPAFYSFQDDRNDTKPKITQRALDDDTRIEKCAVPITQPIRRAPRARSIHTLATLSTLKPGQRWPSSFAREGR
mgnify:CR=1 FL=1